MKHRNYTLLGTTQKRSNSFRRKSSAAAGVAWLMLRWARRLH
jgi:hypothetical protein